MRNDKLNAVQETVSTAELIKLPNNKHATALFFSDEIL